MSPSTPIREPAHPEARAARSQEGRPPAPEPARPALEWLCIPRPPSRNTRWSST